MALSGSQDGRSPSGRSASSIAAAALAVGVLVVLVLLSAILSVGDRLAAVHPAVAVAYYVAVGVLVAVGVVVPVAKVLSRPVFSLYRLRDEHGRSRRLWCRRLAANLDASGLLTPEEARRMHAALDAPDDGVEVLIELFRERAVPAIDGVTKRAAKTAFATTAVSQSPLVDAATMLWISFDLVRSAVEACGFRPSNLALARLYGRVMVGALVAGGLEDMDLETLLAGVMGGGAAGKASGIVMASAAQGFVNAFLVFRVGCIVKRYLCAQDGPARMAELRRGSYKDALSLMKSSGFVAEMAGIVKDRAAQAAGYAAQAVKTAAQEAARTAYDSAEGALLSVGRAVKAGPLGRVLKGESRKADGTLPNTPGES